ncbi:MAG: hypothetical protein QXG39_06255 [Candidatus Aenigmatarchaeota archaeon]
MERSNEINVKDFQNQLFNYLINYLISNKKNRFAKAITLHINPIVYQEFVKTLAMLGYPQYQTCGLIVEAFMQYFIDNYRPKGMVQTTLFYKPQINIQQKIEVNIAQKIELKIVKKSLMEILESLEKKKGYPDFYASKLKEILPKAVKLYEKSGDDELKVLLEKAERFI